MKHLLLIGCCVAGTYSVSLAQSLSPQVLSSAGEYKTIGSGSLSYTVGETEVKTYTQNGQVLTQGFQQPQEILSSLLDAQTEAIGFEIYPSPADQSVFTAWDIPADGEVRISITDAQGKLVYNDFNRSETEGRTILPIHTAQLASGNYVISFAYMSENLTTPHVVSKKLQIIHP